MSSSDKNSTSYIRRYTIDPEILNTFVTFLEDEERETESSARVNIPRAPRRYIARNYAEVATRLFNHYFAPEPVYPPDYFRRRFRMPKEMFISIVKDIQTFNSIQPLLKHFQYFHNPGFDVVEYLRKPTQEDVDRVTANHLEVHGFRGVLGSIDCMHWPWRNCPTAWQGQHTCGDKGHPTIMLEAVASYDLWIWHAYFGPTGSNNDINVLNESDLFDQLLEDRAPVVNFTANGEHFTKMYYLADGIYPE
uniref:uncharacterized protein LOC122608817 n=1 Tax=Erigeron canadensis TaxID=72917 RepID=UPI001CB8F886|nr:uncharacterized protein LOC122608817 [Erigeron canadensis]